MAVSKQFVIYRSFTEILQFVLAESRNIIYNENSIVFIINPLAWTDVIDTSDEGFGRDNIVCYAEGEVAVNSQAKGPNLDDTLESGNAPKKQSLSR